MNPQDPPLTEQYLWILEVEKGGAWLALWADDRLEGMFGLIHTRFKPAPRGGIEQKHDDAFGEHFIIRDRGNSPIARVRRIGRPTKTSEHGRTAYPRGRRAADRWLFHPGVVAVLVVFAVGMTGLVVGGWS